MQIRVIGDIPAVKPASTPLAALFLIGMTAVMRASFANAASTALPSIWDLGLNQNQSKWVRRTLMRGFWPSDNFQHGEARAGTPVAQYLSLKVSF